jgi:hypothetical protein
MIRMYSHELISDKGWQLSNYGCSDNLLTGGSLVTDGRVTQNFRKEK